METIVSLRDISFGYGEGLILEDINLHICRGDYLGIVGPNGSGKSTLLKLMLGIIKPIKGKVEIFKKDIGSFRHWGRVGYVPQKATSFNSGFPATVEEVVGANLFSRIGLFKSIGRRYNNDIYNALDIVGMKDYGKRLIGNLSGGQQQKVFIARTLVSSPEIIFMDEPTVGIDMNSQKDFFELMDKLNTEMGITIVMISHDIGVITQKANRVACVGDKRIVVHSNPSNMEPGEILRGFYGDNMRILMHSH